MVNLLRIYNISIIIEDVCSKINPKLVVKFRKK